MSRRFDPNPAKRPIIWDGRVLGKKIGGLNRQQKLFVAQQLEEWAVQIRYVANGKLRLGKIPPGN